MTSTPVLTGEPVKTHRFIQILEDGTEFDCVLPISPTFNDSTGVLFYRNKGFIPYDEYQAKKHQTEVAARKQKGKENDSAGK